MGDKPTSLAILYFPTFTFPFVFVSILHYASVLLDSSCRLVEKRVFFFVLKANEGTYLYINLTKGVMVNAYFNSSFSFNRL